MKRFELAAPLLASVVATRVMLGMGLGFLMADRFGLERRRQVGLVLLALGALSTPPLAGSIFRSGHEA